MSKLSRRSFLKGSSVAVTVPLMSTAANVQAEENSAASGSTTLEYPQTAVSKAGDLAINNAVSFNFPDASSPCAMIRMGHEVPGGVGPDKDIVAYSTLCNHMGCATNYDTESRTFKCPCHFSIFDCEKSGQLVTGQATASLPRIILSYDNDSGEVSAVGVDGLIYGRQANV